MGRILSLDYGTKRIGVALTDETKTIAIPKPFVLNADRDQVLELIKSQEVETVIMGLPIGMSGQETETTEKTKKFAKWLEEKSGVKIEMIDERLSSKEIERSVKDKELVDSLVAQKMLERYLERR